MQSGRFEPRRMLGRGAFSDVMEAFDREKQRLVALKVVRGPHAKDFHARTAQFAAVEHPHVVRILEIVHEADAVGVVMDVVPGVSFVRFVRGASEASVSTGAHLLGQPMQREGASTFSPCSDAAIARLRIALAGLVRGVTALHARSLIHGDLRPDNVIVSDKGHAGIVDLASGDDVSVAYSAPEGTTSPASDWYSVGAIVFEALTGGAPFSGSAQQVAIAKSTIAPPRPSFVVSSVPQDLDELVAAWMRRDPRARPSGIA